MQQQTKNTSNGNVPKFQSAHEELHYINRSGWLRAAVLGANDGIVSVSSLVVGVAAADPRPSSVLIAGFAGLAAGAMSMAAGEYVSVSSQSDIGSMTGTRCMKVAPSLTTVRPQAMSLPAPRSRKTSPMKTCLMHHSRS